MWLSPIVAQTPAKVVVCETPSPKQCLQDILSCLESHEDSLADVPHNHLDVRKPFSTHSTGKAATHRPPSPPYPRSYDTLYTTLRKVRPAVRSLTASYVDGIISPSDPAISLDFESKAEDTALSRIFKSEYASACNIWQLGILVAKLLLAMLEDDDSSATALEVEMETYIMILLAIALQSHVAGGVIARVINHPPTGIDEVDVLVDRAQKILIDKMRPPTPSSGHSSPAPRPTTISSAPPSPYLERSQILLSSSDRAKRPRDMSRSSTFSAPTTSTVGVMMTKSSIASAVTSEEISPSGSFVPTRSASYSLRSMTSSHTHCSPEPPGRRGRLPLKWFATSSSQRSSSIGAQSSSSSVPSFSRTSSPDSASTAATSVASEVSINLKVPAKSADKQKKRRDSALKVVEDTSPLNVSCSCASCGKQGSNFPRCPRCSETWCSRDCRMASNGGKRHVCQRAPPI